jgi:hypothetical protein
VNWKVAFEYDVVAILFRFQLCGRACVSRAF